MFYDFAITVPKSTTEAAPVTEELKLTHGVIHRIEVQFPVGTMALAHCQLRHWEHQAWPTNPPGSFASDGYTIVIDENFELDTAPYTLKAVCWNDDDTYPHIITVRVGVMESETAIFIIKALKALVKFLQMVGIKV
jgi:hypothetical protein